jgi:hypothetical protein
VAAPGALGNVLIGPEARTPTAMRLFRFYGTRDVALGLGTLWTAFRGGDVQPWLGAGVASDLLDTAVLAEWRDLPAGKRVPGILTAMGAAGMGAALLAAAKGSPVEVV